MTQKLQPIRGMKDILPEEYRLFSFITNLARELGARYGFQEMSVPIVEATEVYQRTLGEASDIVSKEMYSFVDKGEESITLRPEFTAGVARAFISNGLQQSLPLKFFSCGPLFRYERPQKGRQRQFHQINFESLGFSDPLSDVEMIALAARILRELEIPATLELNSLGDAESRIAYREALVSYLTQYQSSLSEDSQRRLIKNPLRILDSKDEKDREIVRGAPTLEAYYTREARDYFHRVLEGLTTLSIPYVVNPYVVRGIDYYAHTIFEFTSEALGAQNTVLAGGRYDQLVETMGGPATPAVGFAAGVERLMALSAYKAHAPRPVCVMPMGELEQMYGLQLAERLRQRGLYVECMTQGNLGKRLKKANDRHASVVAIIGEEELANGQVTLKHLDARQEMHVSDAKVVEAVEVMVAG